MFPLMFDVLVNQMMPASLTASFTVDKYLGLLMEMTVAFGLVFELPLVMWILAAAGIVSPQAFGKMRKYWIVAAFVIGGILTPPDPLSQIMMAVPLLFFFEIGIIGAKILHRRRAEAIAPV